MSSKQNPFTGRSGQMEVVARLLNRGYNVAVPEVDCGDDLYVVQEALGEFSRVQVKSANAKGKKRVAAAFNISLAQLRRPCVPDLVYVLVLYRQGAWRDYLIIPRRDLYRLHVVQHVGYLMDNGRRLVLHVSYSQDDVVCNGVSLKAYYENWERWPEVEQ